MVLEETVTFTKEDDATEFITFLRKNGCPCQKVVRGIVLREEVIVGTLDQIITWYGKEAARYEETGSSQKEAAWFHTGEQKYRQSREQIGELTKGRTPGDILYTREDVDKAMKAVFKPKITEMSSPPDDSAGDAVPAGSSETGGSPLDYPLFMVHWMLMENGVVTQTPDGYSMTREVTPGDISLEFSLDNMPDVDLNNAPGMRPKLQVGLDPVYVVTADPLIHFVCEPDEVMELLSGKEINDEIFDTLAENLYGKQLIIGAIMEEVGKAGGISVTDLAKRITDRRPGKHTPTVEFFLDPPILASVVTEMRKRDILAGNDQKIRMAVKNQGRRK